jgi:hypothetical protein
MSYAVVTLEIPPKQRVDLALPLNVPNHVLAPAIAKALELPDTGEGVYLLSVKTENGIVRLSSETNLAEAGILDGAILQIQRRAGTPGALNAPESTAQAYLQAESGESFPLGADPAVIGRRDAKRGVLVQIDLTPFDAGKIVSRRHAVIEQQAGRFVIVDQDSVNGTWVNGQRLSPHQPYPLQNDDVIIFGRNGVQMKFGKRA